MRDHQPAPGHPDRRLSTKEAAELLGVKPETVYAYVSRGQLSSRRTPGGRGSTFDAKEVEALARRNRRESGGSPGAGGELSVRTRLTLIDKDRYYYRGVDATELAARHPYEEVAEWLWTGRLLAGTAFTAPAASVEAARRAVDALPEHSGPTDRLRVAAVAAAVADPQPVGGAAVFGQRVDRAAGGLDGGGGCGEGGAGEQAAGPQPLRHLFVRVPGGQV
ncbi:citrate synthase, partial [Streptomyces griseoruber]|uniref:citrate synthase n=1 Tax=Streptomyces griseoruber TaxID=1943 RepID=UPI000AE34710